jgi:hypothetical protein
MSEPLTEDDLRRIRADVYTGECVDPDGDLTRLLDEHRERGEMLVAVRAAREGIANMSLHSAFLLDQALTPPHRLPEEPAPRVSHPFLRELLRNPSRSYPPTPVSREPRGHVGDDEGEMPPHRLTEET